MAETETGQERGASAARDRLVRWNLGALMLDVTFFAVGMAFLDGNAVLPLLLERLGAEGWLIGAFAALRFLAFSVPQVGVAFYSRRMARQKPLLSWVAGITRLPLLFLPLIIWRASVSDGARVFALFAVILLLSFWALGDGMGYVPWMEIVARAFTPQTRGRFFAATQFTSGIISIGIAGLVVRTLLHSMSLPFPHNYAVLAGLAALMYQVSLMGVLLIREPPPDPMQSHPAPVEPASPGYENEAGRLAATRADLDTNTRSAASGDPDSLRAYFRRLPALVRANPAFARLAVVQLLIGAGAASSPFYVLYATRHFHIGDEWGGTYQVLQAVSVAALTPLWTWVSEKKSPAHAVRALAFVCLLTPLAALTVGLASPWLFGLVFLLMGGSLGWGMWIVGNQYLLAQIEERERPVYVALINLLYVPAGAYPILGGLLVQHNRFVSVAGVPVLFILTALVIACGALLALRLPVPSRASSASAVPDRVAVSES